MALPHRNSQKRFYGEGLVYFITCNAFERFCFFKEEIFCELWLEELRICKEKFGFELFAFCLNYDHFHLVIKPGTNGNISHVMKFFKENFSRDANRLIEGATAPSRLQISETIYDLQEKIPKEAWISKNNLSSLHLAKIFP